MLSSTGKRPTETEYTANQFAPGIAFFYEAHDGGADYDRIGKSPRKYSIGREAEGGSVTAG
jgi:hypothetical protein